MFDPHLLKKPFIPFIGTPLVYFIEECSNFCKESNEIVIIIIIVAIYMNDEKTQMQTMCFQRYGG